MKLDTANWKTAAHLCSPFPVRQWIRIWLRMLWTRANTSRGVILVCDVKLGIDFAALFPGIGHVRLVS